jgi:negative regulator of flagellin synthesis FlgM
MEINGNNSLVNLNASVQKLDLQQQNQRSPKTGEGSSTSGNDRIELSVRGREIQQLNALIRSTPDIREAKVEQVRSAIENGTYNVKAEKIADKILGGGLVDQIW